MGDDDDDSNDGDGDDEEDGDMSGAMQVDTSELPPPPEPKLQPLGMSEVTQFPATLPSPKDGNDPSRHTPLSMLVGDSATLEMHTPISGDALLCWARAWCGVSTGDVVSALLAFAESMASTLEDCSKDQTKIIQQAQTATRPCDPD